MSGNDIGLWILVFVVYIDIGAFIATMRPSDDQNMYSNFFLTLLWPFAILTIPGASLASFVKSKFHLD